MKIFNYKRVPYAEIRAFSVHMLTASGSFLAFLGVVAAAEHRFVDMFWWLGLALLVDGIDGPIARKVRVKEVLPNWSGDTLDNIIDYVTYVLLPAFAAVTHDAAGHASGPAGTEAILRTVAITLGKVAAFVALMLIVGRRAIPAVLHFVAHTGSRELFRLSVLSVVKAIY